MTRADKMLARLEEVLAHDDDWPATSYDAEVGAGLSSTEGRSDPCRGVDI